MTFLFNLFRSKSDLLRENEKLKAERAEMEKKLSNRNGYIAELQESIRGYKAERTKQKNQLNNTIKTPQLWQLKKETSKSILFAVKMIYAQ